MKVVKQGLEVINGLRPMEHIEKIGRICYKSESKITEDSAARFVKMLFENKHHAMLEHYRFILQVSPVIYEPLTALNLRHFEFSFDNERCLISFSARALLNMVEDSHCADYGFLPMAVSGIRDELIGHICKAFDCYELFGKSRDEQIILSTGVEFIPNSPNNMSEKEWNRHGWKSISFVTDRGISHELVRHREETAFAQESTRYCNYKADKFGNEITVIDQGFDGEAYEIWKYIGECCERSYFEMLSAGLAPQMARSVLPTCLKTEIVITAPIYEWKHIMNLRYHGTTGKPHPMVKELVTPLVEKGVFEYGKD